MKKGKPFLTLWVLAVAASSAAFVLHLALRSRTMHLGYSLGRERARQGRLREVKRVLELEVSSYQTPQRVEVVARSLLGMSPPGPERILAMPRVYFRRRSAQRLPPKLAGKGRLPSAGAAAPREGIALKDLKKALPAATRAAAPRVKSPHATAKKATKAP